MVTVRLINTRYKLNAECTLVSERHRLSIYTRNCMQKFRKNKILSKFLRAKLLVTRNNFNYIVKWNLKLEKNVFSLNHQMCEIFDEGVI